MSRRIYDQGELVQEWDDEAQVYRRWVGGVLVEERAYTAAEIAGILGLGGITVDGNNVYMYDDDGSIIFLLGIQTHGDRGITISRNSGQRAIELKKPFSNSVNQVLALYDSYGNPMLTESSFGIGLGEPFIPMPMQPVGGTATPGPYGWERTITSGTFTDVFRWQGARQNAYARFSFNVRTTVADTSCELQLVNDAGSVLAPFFAAPWVGTLGTGSTADRDLTPPGLNMTFVDWFDDAVVRVQARRTAGTGNVIVSVKKSEGGAA